MISQKATGSRMVIQNHIRGKWRFCYFSYFFMIQLLYLQPIITQYFIDNKSEIWLLFLIAHSKR